MGFWTFCCKRPEHRRLHGGSALQFRNVWDNKVYLRNSVCPVVFSYDQQLDAEGDWISLSDQAGVLSDGSLWCWNPNVVSLISFSTGLDTERRPYESGFAARVGTANDWVSVNFLHDCPAGYAINQKGEMWAFGANTDSALGIGLVNKTGLNFSSSSAPGLYEVKLDSAIASVSTIPPLDVYSSKRPTRIILGYKNQQDEQGNLLTVETAATQNASLEFDWFGGVFDADLTITSGGSGYTSLPTVELVGNGADSGKVVVGSVTGMTPSSVVGFSVKNGGQGYTYATAYDSYSKATATALIENGVIAGWAIKNPAVFTQSLLSVSQNNVTVCGDGRDATADVVLSGSSVTSITFPRADERYDAFRPIRVSELIWTETPQVRFTGGGGSGATASISRIRGAVTAIRLISPGSGYPAPQDIVAVLDASDTIANYPEVKVGEAALTPSKIKSVDLLTPSDPIAANSLNPGNTGTVSPFTYIAPIGSGIGTLNNLSAQLVGGGKTSTVTLSKSSQGSFQTFSLAAPVAGYKYPPLLRVWQHYSEGPYSLASAVITSGSSAGSSYPTGWIFGFLTQGKYSYPCKDASVTVTATPAYTPPYPPPQYLDTFQYTATFKNIDGVLLLESQNYKKAAGNLGDVYRQIGLSDKTSTFTNNTPTMDTAANRVEHTWQEPSSNWTPPSIQESVRFYFEPPTHGGEPPLFVAHPTSEGNIGVPVVAKPGGYYVTPPAFRATSEVFAEPVKVEADGAAWKSASSKGNIFYAVSQDNRLYWWGYDAANIRNICPFPSPVGRGVGYDITGGTRGVDLALRYRFYCDPPQHGNRISTPPTDFFRDQQPGAERSPRESLYKESFMGSDRIAKKVLINPGNRFFCSYDVMRNEWQGAGAGYTSQPAAYFLKCGPTAEYQITARLIGPEFFTKVDEGVARSIDGRWYQVVASAFIVPPPYQSFSTTTTVVENRENVGTGLVPFLMEVTTTTAITYGDTRRWFCAAPATVGSGYDGGSVKLAWRESINAQTITSITQTGTVDEGNKTSTYTTVTQKNALVQSNQISYGIGGGDRISYALWGITIDPSQTKVLIENSPGAGSTASIAYFDEAFESHLPPITTAGAGDFISRPILGSPRAFNGKRSGFVAVKNDKLVSFYSAFTDTTDFWPLGSCTEIVADRFRSSDAIYLANSYSLRREFPLTLSTDATGSGYDDVPKVIIDQQPGVAKFSCEFAGSVSTIGVLNRGRGYSSPPAITLATSDGEGDAGSAKAVIAGPVYDVKVTSAGSGYTIPPRVKFSGAGIAPSAFAVLNENGGVASVSLADGGRYRNSPPSVSFEPIPQVSGLTLLSGGQGYNRAPLVHVGGGGGVGAAAVARIDGKVSKIDLVSGGAGFSAAPAVIISGGGGTGATASCKISAIVQAIVITDPGAGYASPPTVTLTGGGGSGAEAEASLEVVSGNSGVAAVSVTDGGENYTSPPTVQFQGECEKQATAFAVITGGIDSVSVLSPGSGYREPPDVSFLGGGGGAEAKAILDGFVDQLTLLSPGEGFVNAPEVVFYDGGGDGAAATAQIAAAGGGAEATARINGSLIYCTASGSSKLQADPIVTVNHGTNFLLSQLDSQFSSGTITKSEYDAQSEPLRATAKARIHGTVTKVNVDDGGTLYKVQSESIYGVNMHTRLRNPGCVAASLFAADGGGSTIGYVSLPCTASGGSITSVDASSIASTKYWHKPTFIASDGVAALPVTDLTLAGAGVIEAKNNAGPVSWDGTSANGIRSADSNRTPYENRRQDEQSILQPHVISVTGSLADYFFTADSAPYYAGGFKVLWFNPFPSIEIQDECGSGGAAEFYLPSYFSPNLSGLVYAGPNGNLLIKATSGGSNYTLAARAVVTGGSPKCWSSPASATATVSNGRVVAINIASSGSGYVETPDVFLIGGGGEGARAEAALDTLGKVTAIRLSCEGEGYDSAPQVKIVDRDRQYQDTLAGQQAQQHTNAYGYFRLSNYKVEFCAQDVAWQINTPSPATVFYGAHNATFAPFFKSDGFVEMVAWDYIQEPALSRDFANLSPAVTIVGNCQTKAAASISEVKFTSVFSPANAKTVGASYLPPEDREHS